ncbi:MAG TPA: carboxysome shell carbonic anhydrase [Thiomonas arsenitoxydans]|uniref:Carboxysome shell carbonic anhydrase n=1 Tax=Thiomonas intermedia (strain K12) TaxID=75379 RepID=D5X333_THIK1|nr:carboxysome shell carbonic anhydrase [Thiomonas arsenitoxydans]
MNTLKRRTALQASGAYLPTQEGSAPHLHAVRPALHAGEHAIDNPACVIGPGQRCEHALVDSELNCRLSDYERIVRGRFSGIVDVLKEISALQHERDFAERAQRLAQERLGYALPQQLLDDAWVSGLDMKALHTHCIFQSFKVCVDRTDADQSLWLNRMALTPEFLAACGYHTVDVTPCADGRLQGLLPFVFRMAPNRNVYLKAYAGAMFDVEADMVDWGHREIERLSGGIPGGESQNYLKIAVYHFSSSHSHEQGCAFHASNDKQAVESAKQRLDELRIAIERTYGVGAAPDILLVGLDTDVDALRIHLPDADGDVNPYRYVDTAELYRETVGLTAQAARAHIAQRVDEAQNMDGWAQGRGVMIPGMRQLVLALAEANLSQIEYVIHHHQGRYTVLGHDEEFICAGEATQYVQMRNKYYFAHLDTVEEGAADVDVGIKIFTGLNVRHGLSVPVLVHFYYSSRVPGSRERALNRAKQVKAAIEARYPALVARELLTCRMALSDRFDTERCVFVDEAVADSGH